ncbi:translation initiation factor IF-2-like [Falco naumanni]|uniref:translation initiation factor IF-2-like n=1 Tax=Falco naumanni TaxID=148594 RepID=UPI001ADE9970|nr:translation initiation factor IF-2-like [Falco naumanni]XP_040444283.1 translation initiation factor IF-2-like [Falco naumanni]
MFSGNVHVGVGDLVSPSPVFQRPCPTAALRLVPAQAGQAPCPADRTGSEPRAPRDSEAGPAPPRAGAAPAGQSRCRAVASGTAPAAEGPCGAWRDPGPRGDPAGRGPGGAWSGRRPRARPAIRSRRAAHGFIPLGLGKPRGGGGRPGRVSALRGPGAGRSGTWRLPLRGPERGAAPRGSSMAAGHRARPQRRRRGRDTHRGAGLARGGGRRPVRAHTLGPAADPPPGRDSPSSALMPPPPCRGFRCSNAYGRARRVIRGFFKRGFTMGGARRPTALWPPPLLSTHRRCPAQPSASAAPACPRCCCAACPRRCFTARPRRRCTSPRGLPFQKRDKLVTQIPEHFS